jgi:hypothetical protein
MGERHSEIGSGGVYLPEIYRKRERPEWTDTTQTLICTVRLVTAGVARASGCHAVKTMTASTARTASAGYTRLRLVSGKRGIGSNG